MKNFKSNYLVFGGSLVLMICGLAACNNSSTYNADTNGVYSTNASTNADIATNTQSNSS